MWHLKPFMSQCAVLGVLIPFSDSSSYKLIVDKGMYTVVPTSVKYLVEMFTDM